MSKSLRETVLEQQLCERQAKFQLMHQMHLATLSTIVYYLGGSLTLSVKDYQDAQGVLLTEEMDQAAGLRTFRTHRIGSDGAQEVAGNGLLPPDAGIHNGGDHAA